MAGFLAPTPGLMMWNRSSTAQSLGLTTDVVRDYSASGSRVTVAGCMEEGAYTLSLGHPADFRNGQGVAVAGAGPQGGLLVTTIIGGEGTSNLTLAQRASTAVPNTAVPTPLVQHDDSWAWQAAIDAAPEHSLITCPPGSHMNIAAPLRLRSNVVLALPAATLYWIGPDSGTVFTSSTATALQQAGIVAGGYVDPGQAGTVIDLYSPQLCTFDLNVLDGSPTMTVMRWTAATGDSAHRATADAPQRATTGNVVHRLVAGTCGTLLSLAGQPDAPATGNTFLFLEGQDCRVSGVVCESAGYVDTNTFLRTRLTLTAPHCIGVDLGCDGAPHVSNLVFVDLSIHNASESDPGTGLYLRKSTSVQTLSYHYSGAGTACQSSDATSYYIRFTGVGGPPDMQDVTKGWSVTPLQIGPKGTPIVQHISSAQTIAAPIAILPPQSGILTACTVDHFKQGDTVIATPLDIMTPGLVWQAGYLRGAQVALYFTNVTQAPIPLQSTSWRFDIWQH